MQEFEGYGECIQLACKSTTHSFEEITDDEGRGIGSRYVCLWCGTMDVRWTQYYRNMVVDEVVGDDPGRGVIYLILLEDDIVVVDEEEFNEWTEVLDAEEDDE